jgi:predicted unusual protein kinase regulating ubiquinone biosynthesis (AarF/ABC1/UbiB family)
VSDIELPRDPAEWTARHDGIRRGRFARAVPIASLAARAAGEAIVVGLHSKLTNADTTELHVRWAERYAELLGHSRGALMKAGQMLTLTASLAAVPTELQPIHQLALGRLRDDAPPMSGELARAVLEHELGRRLDSVFAEFDPEPLAAASIGQVHTARLRDGREVAVKLQYPGVADAIDADLKNVELLGTFLSLVVAFMSLRRAGFNVDSAARELSLRIGEELDYRREAANQAEFADLYRGHPYIHVPNVIVELCTERMLTQELVHGWRWSEALGARQELRDLWAETIYRFIFGSFYRFDLFNADPHPGNFLFHEDGSVSFLDFGCVKRYDRELVDTMIAIFRACLQGDVLGTWRATVNARFVQPSVAITPAESYAIWRESLEFAWGPQPFTVTPEYVSRWLQRRYAPRGALADAFRQICGSSEFMETMMLGRVEAITAALLAQLRATNHWGWILAEGLEGAPPRTEMGRLEEAFFARREVTSHA